MNEKQIKQFPTSAEEYFHKQEKDGIPWKTEVYQFFEVIRYYRKATKELQEDNEEAKKIIRELSKYLIDSKWYSQNDQIRIQSKLVAKAEAFLNDKCPFTKEECCIFGTVHQCKKCDKE